MPCEDEESLSQLEEQEQELINANRVLQSWKDKNIPHDSRKTDEEKRVEMENLKQQIDMLRELGPFKFFGISKEVLSKEEGTICTRKTVEGKCRNVEFQLKYCITESLVKDMNKQIVKLSIAASENITTELRGTIERLADPGDFQDLQTRVISKTCRHGLVDTGDIQGFIHYKLADTADIQDLQTRVISKFSYISDLQTWMVSKVSYISDLQTRVISKLADTGDIQGFLQLIDGYTKWTEARRKTFHHFVEAHPGTVSQIDGNTLHIASKKGTVVLGWGVKIQGRSTVVPEIHLCLDIHAPVSKDNKNFIEDADEKFQLMLNELGIEKSIRCLVEVA
ncbi:CENPP-like protein [Mya arenaria]|uniref:CENPP-like protein n=1 Tax=Mya arenaria TaxID=6604 RepID=A0ABY7FY80_MYAAR|nr:CENPP-like protein [Mya arenaria]